MKPLVNCFIPYADAEQAKQTIKNLKSTGLVDKIYLMSTQAIEKVPQGCRELRINHLNSSRTILAIAEQASAA